MSNLLNKKLAGATLPALQQVFDNGSASDKASFQSSVSGYWRDMIGSRLVGHWDVSAATDLAGGAVSVLPDLSGAGAHLTQHTSAARPIVELTSGGRKSLAFDGVDDFLRCASFGGTYPTPGGIAPPIYHFYRLRSRRICRGLQVHRCGINDELLCATDNWPRKSGLRFCGINTNEDGRAGK
jgi:hypothetical protein